MKVSTENGKYTFIPFNFETIFVQRYAQPWGQLNSHQNALRSLLCELDAARVVLQAARDLGDDAPVQIKDALRKHDGLVDDQELPSEWSR